MKRLFPLLALAALVSALAACGGGGGGSNDTTSTSAASSVPNPLVFCVDTTYPPAESIVNGKAQGYDIDIANAIAKQLGSTAQIKTTGFDVIIPALKQKKCDAIISSMTVTPERAKQVHFSPYVNVGAFLMVKKGNPAHITDLASLSGKSAAVEAATTELAGLQAENKTLKKQGKPEITIKSYPADTSAAAAIQSGKVEAYFADAPPVLYYIRTTHGKFETAGKQLETAPEGIATRIGDPLGAKINNAIQALYLNGKMKSILAKWQASQFALQNK
ncbi:MAG TPA: ABC transporter substrate-binding protein [Gaiellaceae bacterium]|nr:ABC transporter substrate-binding protein [Gaiellaceae bacterium]